MGWQLHVHTCYNALYAGYAWREVKATYGSGGWPVYGALLNQIWTRPTFLLLLLPPPLLLLQPKLCFKSDDCVYFCSGCLVPGQSCQRVSTHSVLVVFFLTSAAHFNAACGPPRPGCGQPCPGQSKLSPRAGPGLKPRAGPVPGNARHGLKPLMHHIVSLQKFGTGSNDETL